MAAGDRNAISGPAGASSGSVVAAVGKREVVRLGSKDSSWEAIGMGHYSKRSSDNHNPNPRRDPLMDMARSYTQMIIANSECCTSSACWVVVVLYSVVACLCYVYLFIYFYFFC